MVKVGVRSGIRDSVRFMLLCGVLGAGSGAGSAAPASCAPAPTSRLVLNVKAAPYRAAGDGVTDDTQAIQRAIRDVAGSGGTVLVPDGTYLINVIAQDRSHGLVLGSRMTFRMAPKAVLKAIPTAQDTFAILAVVDASEVNVVGGTLEGERAAHLGTGGESGMGLKIKGSKQVVVEAVTARECWGDGFYVAGASSGITLCGVTADHNRRQGLSIVCADGMVVRDSTFINTTGTEPEFGIDVEPNRGETVANLQILDCVVRDNRGGGIGGGPGTKDLGAAFFIRSRIAHNTVNNNGMLGIALSACDGNVIENNTVRGTRGDGITLRSQATNIKVLGNTISGSSKDGITLEDCAGSVVTGNTVTGNARRGISGALGSGASVSGNKVSGNGWPF